MRFFMVVVAALALVAAPALGADHDAIVKRASLSLQLGSAISAQSYWNPHGLAGAVTYDVPIARALSLVLTAATSSGTRYSGYYGTSRLSEQHVGAGIRLISRQHGVFRAYGWAGLALLRYTAYQSTSTAGALGGLGLLAAIRAERLFLVAELTALRPFDQSTSGVVLFPPQQAFATVGLRFVL